MNTVVILLLVLTITPGSGEPFEQVYELRRPGPALTLEECADKIELLKIDPKINNASIKFKKAKCVTRTE